MADGQDEVGFVSVSLVGDLGTKCDGKQRGA